MHASNEYRLDFVIPRGATGPTGPSGLSSLCYVEFDDTTTTGNMAVAENRIFPSSSTDYTVDSNTVTINQTGNYEITFCGRIGRNTANKIIDVQLMCNRLGTAINMPGMSGQWKDGTQVIHFSQTGIYSLEPSTTFVVLVTMNETTNFNINAVNLIIKKLPF